MGTLTTTSNTNLTIGEVGANLFKIMDVSRHKSVQTVKGYVRNAEMFKDHAGSSFL